MVRVCRFVVGHRSCVSAKILKKMDEEVRRLLAAFNRDYIEPEKDPRRRFELWLRQYELSGAAAILFSQQK